MSKILNPNQQMLPHPYETIEQIPLEENETLTAIFTEGRCHIYALTVQKAHPSYILKAIYRNDIIEHIYCVTEEGKVIDATGTYDNLEGYIDSDLLHKFLLVEHEDITKEEILSMVEESVLITPTVEAENLAISFAKKLNHI